MSLLAGFILPHPPIIIPDIGQGEERKINQTIDAYHRIAIKISQLKPRVIIILTPHHENYQDYFHISPGNNAWGSLEAFGSLERFNVDYYPAFISRFHQLFPNFPAGEKGERHQNLDHGVMVPLYFIQKYYKDFSIVRISMSGLSLSKHHRFGQCIYETMTSLNEDYLVIASGDLSHKLKITGPYGFVQEGVTFDQMMVEYMKKGAFDKMMTISPKIYHKAEECGLKNFVILGGILDKESFLPKLESYQGPFGVGYGIASYITGDPYILLARHTLNNYFNKEEDTVGFNQVPEDMYKTMAGVFVSLKYHGRLRGCIGTIFATSKNIKEEIIQNTLSAALNDPRFHPISQLELDELSISVDILKKPERIDSKSLLDIKKYGVIVRYGHQTGLLLPRLEGINHVEEQIRIALEKAGISQHAPYELSRFEVIRHQEK